MTLKELRNFVLRIICTWSLFCSLRIYILLHFLPIHLKTLFVCVPFLFCNFFWVRIHITDFFYKSLLNCVRCVLKTCSRANIPCVLTCSRASVLTWSRANVPCVLMCSRANVPYLLTYLRALHAYVLTCQRALHAFVFRCQRALCAYVLMFLASERAQVPTCFACLSAHGQRVLRAYLFIS